MPFKKDEKQPKLIEELDNLYGDMVRGVTDDEVIQARFANIIKREQKKESVEKICPFAFSTMFQVCIGKRCAWWMKDDCCCAITSLAWSQDVMAGYAKESK